MKPNIRRAIIEDAAGIAEILREMGWHDELLGESPEESARRVRRQLEQALSDESHSVWTAVRGNDVLGYVMAHWLPRLFLGGPEGYVSELFVRGDARGGGLGTRLLEAVKEEAKTRGCARLGLLNGRQRESYHRGFYTKRGWTERPPIANFILPL